MAFLNSVRAHNPHLPVCLIPFDDHVSKLMSLQPRYAFSVFSNQDTLRQCDTISRRFHERTMGHYRKLAAWEGEFDEFFYIDVDTVVLADLGFAFDFLSGLDFLASHSRLPELVRWVWKPSIRGAGALSEPQIAYSANTGFLGSRRGVLSIRELDAQLAGAVALADHMEFYCVEQPVLNFLIVTSGKRYSSLLEIWRETRNPQALLEHWAGNIQEGIRVEGGRLTFEGRPAPVMLVHWAGLWKSPAVDGARVQEDAGSHEGMPVFAVDPMMPLYDLWNYYRCLA
ncbi:MAG TPA: hypothetical protein VF584_07340 [Longimicrobium sp.]